MWVSTAKGKLVRQPTAAVLLGALAATAPGESIMVARDLMRWIYVARHEGSPFAVWVRDGTHERQVRIDYADAQDVAAAIVAFATQASFAREIVDAASASEAA
jgi:hypothetical protein